jgi:hypothetical protein
MVCPARDASNVIKCGPGALLTAVIASRSEIPSGPGFTIKASGLATSPLSTSVEFETIRTAALDVDGIRQLSVSPRRSDTGRGSEAALMGVNISEKDAQISSFSRRSRPFRRKSEQTGKK